MSRQKIHKFLLREPMSYQIKLLSWPDLGNYVIAITRDLITVNGLRKIFGRLTDLTQSLPDCKIIIDLEEASYRLERAEISALVDELKPELWARKTKIAMVSPSARTEYNELLILSTYLSQVGFKVAVFDGPKAAIDWLAEPLTIIE